MKYRNAKELLPDVLVKELQKYIQGGYLYIPAKKEEQKRWGELSGYRKELDQRNKSVTEEYIGGSTVGMLATKYCLSESAIRKIIYQK